MIGVLAGGREGGRAGGRVGADAIWGYGEGFLPFLEYSLMNVVPPTTHPPPN